MMINTIDQHEPMTISQKLQSIHGSCVKRKAVQKLIYK